ncbi:flavin reductase [Microbacterium sp. RD1]|uniref:flavin reductase n=1 Tax=Microbacterium sp. RD1 TaxID=3457313 RepID=UPI003FA5A126
MNDSKTALPAVDGREFRNVVGHLASGVTVITTGSSQRRHGMTASSVTSLSADPPLMLVCINNSAPTATAVAETGHYAVNILAERGGDLAYRFAAPSTDKFAGVAVREGVLGAPLLEDALARIECEVVESVVGGTHTIYIGRVVKAEAGQGQPLTYFRGGFGKFAQVRDDAVYRALRHSVLTREYAPGAVLSVADLAVTLEAEESSIFYALTRLSGDGLVRRELDAGYVVLPFDTRSSDATFDARLVIELGVIEKVCGEVAPQSLDELEARFDEMAALLVEDRFVDFDAYLEANYRFHESLVSLADSPVLTAMFEGLAIKSVMTRSFGATAETSQRFVDVQRQMVQALRAGDKTRAQGSAVKYSEIAKDRAREVLALSGGVM